MGEEWGRREGRAKTTGARIKVQGAQDKRARAAFRIGFDKLDQPALTVVRAAAVAAADTAGRPDRLWFGPSSD